MKKTLLLLASAALLLVGCQKEQIAQKTSGEGKQTVSFTVGVESAATKAVADGDGAAANINHWIMQVLDSDGDVYNYQEHDGELGVKTHTFNVPLVKGQTYQVLFWADTKNSYVVTDLRTVKRAEAVSLIANRDDLDAFSAVVEDFSTTVASQQNITLKRPFAQLNVVFTDLKKLYETMNNAGEYAKFIPTDFVAKVKVPTTFNVLNQKAGTPAATALEMKAATDYLGNYTSHLAKETLYMDYIFASKDTKDVVDIDFSFVSKGVAIAHNFTSIPFQRNYRTNILGEFMSANATWNVVVDPIWDSESDGSKDINVYYTEVNKASEVKGAIESKTEDPSKDGQPVAVTINDEVGGPTNNDIIIPDNTPKENTPEIILDFKKLAAGAQIVIRDEKHIDGQEVPETAKQYEGEVVVIVPEGTTAEQVKILTNKSTVTVRGEYGTVIASCAPQTIIVEKETVIGKLQVAKGNVEVYGKVTSIENITDPQEIVYVYLFQGSTWTNVETETDEKLVPLFPVAKIGEEYYFTLAEALTAVKKGDVLTLTSDITLSEKLLINGGKDFTLDLGGKTLNGRVNVDGAKLVVKNGTIKANIPGNKDAGIAAQQQALNVYGTKNPQYKDGIYTYVKVENDVILDGSNGGLCVMSINGETMYPLTYGVKVDFYGKAINVPAQVSGNIGYDNYVANIGQVDISANLPAGINAPSKAMSLYGPIVNIYGEMNSSSAGAECQAFILSGMARVNVFEGAHIEGSEGIAMKSGNLHVYGGTIKSNGAKKDPVQAVNSGSEASGAAISITGSYTHDLFEDRAKIQVAIEGGDIQADNNAALLVTHSYKDSKAVVLKQGVDLAISGGKFTSGSGIPVIFIDNAAEGDAFPMPSKFISGGLYNKEPEAGYIALGKKAENNSAGLWEIIVDPTVYVVEEMTETMVIPEGITHLVASDELAAARLAAEPWMSEDDARDPFFMDNTVTKVSLPASMTPVSGLFYNTRALKEVEFDGSGNFVVENVPIINSYYVEKITIKNLPETCQFYGVNDNSKPNQYLINLDTSKSDGPKKIEIFLPAGWIEKGYQYKFNSCCATPIYTYEDGKLIGYCKDAKWYTVTEVNEKGVQSIIASEDGNDQTAVIYAAENTVIPSGVTELVASEEMQNDPARTADPEWPFDQNQALKSVWFPTTLLVNNQGKQEFNGTFCRCKNLESITLEGGNDMLITYPMVAWCTGFKSLIIEKLPTTFAFTNGCNDNTSVNPYWLYMDGSGMPGVTVKVYLPNGWKAAGYQYKLSSQIESDKCPTIEVYEADAEGNYQLLGKSVNNVWQDPE